MSEPVHGRYTTYCNHACRCGPCREDQSRRIAVHREARRAERIEIEGRLVHPAATHGRDASYTNYYCRCEPCTAAHNTNRKART